MVINHATKEITAKIVYYGPALSGKTTNLQYLHEVLDPKEKGKLLTISTNEDRTIFFDFMPIEAGEIKGFKLRFQLYTVPGQTYYEETRKRVLKGVDGIVFVADSQKEMTQANKESFLKMKEHLVENGINPDKIPIVLQFNKRDLSNILSCEEIDRYLNPGHLPFFEAIATEGVGVEDTLKSISKLVVNNILKQISETQKLTKDGRTKIKEDFFAMDTKKLLNEIGIKTTSPKKGVEELFSEEIETKESEEIAPSTKERDELLFEPDPVETSLLESDEEPLLLTPEEELKEPFVDVADTGNFTKVSGVTIKAGERIKLNLEIEGKKYSLLLELKEE